MVDIRIDRLVRSDSHAIALQADLNRMTEWKDICETQFFIKNAKYSISIDQSWGHTPGGALPRLSYVATHGGHASRVSMQAPFPYQVTPSRRHRLAAAKSSVGIPLTSSKSGCLLRKQPDQDRLPGIVPHAHIAAVGVDGLCW